MSNVVEGEPRDSREWFGSYLDEDGVVLDVMRLIDRTYCPPCLDSDRILHRSEMTRWAINGQPCGSS
jgi:hypothetical protein